jgi:hypothetical protein
LTFTSSVAATGCDSSDTLVATVNANPVLSAGGDQMACAGDLVSLAGAVGPPLGRYKWAQNAWLHQQRDLRFGSTTVTLLAEN